MVFDRTEALRVIGELWEIDMLTDWEDQFISDIELLLARNHPLTIKQTDTLKEIAQRHGVALFEGRTISEDDLWR